jgi:hypothetical protein
MAVVALAHLAAGAARVFGMYEPVLTGANLLAPLLNGNHLSGFLSMGVPILLAAGLEARERGVRILGMTAAVVVGATTLLAVSRGGATSLVVGMLTLGLLPSSQAASAPARIDRRHAAHHRWHGGDGRGLRPRRRRGLYADFGANDLSKIELAQRARAAIQNAWVGVGRDGFSA